MPKKRSPAPPLADDWGSVFCHKEVQKLLIEARGWKLPKAELAKSIFRAFETALAFAERPSKRSNTVGDILYDYDWRGNEWFFKLCAAICAARLGASVDDKVVDASRMEDISIKDVAENLKLETNGIRFLPSAVSVILTRERKRRAAIVGSWIQWDGAFFRG